MAGRPVAASPTPRHPVRMRPGRRSSARVVLLGSGCEGSDRRCDDCEIEADPRARATRCARRCSRSVRTSGSRPRAASGPLGSTVRRSGEELFTIQEKKLSVRDKMDIERGGQTVASVRKALVSPLRDRFSIEVAGGEDMEAKGNIVDHEYKIERGGDQVAEISKRWFRIRDTYGIEIAPGQDDALLLALTVCIDQMGRG
jgi:uncharacterized protein YxjI